MLAPDRASRGPWGSRSRRWTISSQTATDSFEAFCSLLHLVFLQPHFLPRGRRRIPETDLLPASTCRTNVLPARRQIPTSVSADASRLALGSCSGVVQHFVGTGSSSFRRDSTDCTSPRGPHASQGRVGVRTVPLVFDTPLLESRSRVSAHTYRSQQWLQPGPSDPTFAPSRAHPNRALHPRDQGVLSSTKVSVVVHRRPCPSARTLPATGASRSHHSTSPSAPSSASPRSEVVVVERRRGRYLDAPGVSERNHVRFDEKKGMSRARTVVDHAPRGHRRGQTSDRGGDYRSSATF